MSRTYRRLDEQSLNETRDTIEWYEYCKSRFTFKSRRHNLPAEKVAALAHSDNHESFHAGPPDKAWRRMSHQARRSIERDELNKVMKYEDHDFHIDLRNQTHRLDLWDWY